MDTEDCRQLRNRTSWAEALSALVSGMFDTCDRYAAFIDEFERCRIARSRWTHHAHLAVALWYVRLHGSSVALELLRERIRLVNDSNGVANTDTNGYHETITRAFVQGVTEHHKRHKDLEALPSLEALLISPVGRSDWPLRHWSRERLFSVEARKQWVAPDLQKLP
jgi:hypothetical protein